MYLSSSVRQAVWASVVVLSIGSSGCASVVPPFDVPYEKTGPNTVVPSKESIYRRIQCELIDIKRLNPNSELNELLIAQQDIHIVIELSLSSTLDGKVAPTFSLLGAPFSFGTGFSYMRAREQTHVTSLELSLDALSRTRWDKICENPADTNLAGNLGLTQMFNENKTASFLDWSAKGSYGVFGGSITFTVESQLLATGPTFTFSRFEGVGPFFTTSNKNVDRLLIAFVRGPKAQGAAARIIGENFIAGIKQNQIANSLSIIANGR